MEGTETGDTSSGESLINELVTVHLTTGGTTRALKIGQKVGKYKGGIPLSQQSRSYPLFFVCWGNVQTVHDIIKFTAHSGSMKQNKLAYIWADSNMGQYE